MKRTYDWNYINETIASTNISLIALDVMEKIVNDPDSEPFDKMYQQQGVIMLMSALLDSLNKEDETDAT